jgi:hypothetical protein
MFRVAGLKKKAPVVRTTEAEYLRGCRAELRCCIRVENAVVAVSVPGLGLACAAEKGPRMRGGRGFYRRGAGAPTYTRRGNAAVGGLFRGRLW